MKKVLSFNKANKQYDIKKLSPGTFQIDIWSDNFERKEIIECGVVSYYYTMDHESRYLLGVSGLKSLLKEVTR